MTPKEKATELVNQYYNAPFNCKDCEMPFCDVPCTRLNMNEAKECALIAVYEIMESPYNYEDFGAEVPEDSPDTSFYWDKFNEFWEQVKQEIEQL